MIAQKKYRFSGVIFLALSIILGKVEIQAGVNSEDLRSLIRAQAPAEVVRIKISSQESMHLEMVCKEQLKGQVVPSACFSFIRSRNQIMTEKDQWLRQLCEKRAGESIDIRHLEKTLNSSDLPLSCRQKVEQRLGDLIYAAEMEKPVQIFEMRYGNRVLKRDWNQN